MPWLERASRLWFAQGRSGHAWGAWLGPEDTLSLALLVPKNGVVRVAAYERQHAPDDLMRKSRVGWGGRWPWPQRTMALALGEGRCRQGALTGAADWDAQRLLAEVQLEAAAAWSKAPHEVGFDFQVAGPQVHWVACLQADLQRWRGQARSAGWRLSVVEPSQQAAHRALLHWRGDAHRQEADPPQDWQFSRSPERTVVEVDWPRWQAGPLWQPLAACGAALGVLL